MLTDTQKLALAAVAAVEAAEAAVKAFRDALPQGEERAAVVRALHLLDKAGAEVEETDEVMHAQMAEEHGANING